MPKRSKCPKGCHRVLPSQLLVYLGLTDVTEVDTVVPYDVKSIIIHPGWDLAAKVKLIHQLSFS